MAHHPVGCDCARCQEDRAAVEEILTETIENDMKSIYDLYRSNPPVEINKISGNVQRHMGSQVRGAFWAGYDNLRGGIYPPAKSAIHLHDAYAAGEAYRAEVDAGISRELPPS